MYFFTIIIYMCLISNLCEILNAVSNIVRYGEFSDNDSPPHLKFYPIAPILHCANIYQYQCIDNTVEVHCPKAFQCCL